MIRPRLFALALIASMIGCSPAGPSGPISQASRPDAQTTPLAGFKVGSEAIVSGSDGSTGLLMLTEKGRGSIGGDLESIDAGTKVRIVADPAENVRIDFAKSPVRIMILDGKHAGLPGTVERSELRPLP